jgi:L-fuconolactonase
VTTLRIDAHHHFWDPAEFHYPWMDGEALDPVRRAFTPANMMPALAADHIDGTVLIQTVSDLTETIGFLELTQETPSVLGVVGWVDLTDRAVGDTLDELQARYGRLLVGIRHQVHDEPDPRWLERDDVRRGLEIVRSRDLRYDLLVRTRELPSATATVRAMPDQHFVLDHIAKPRIAQGWDEQWSEAIAMLAREPNVTVKLSGMVTEASWHEWTPETLRPFVERVLELFGVQRVMFGSDWPVCLLAAESYHDVVAALAVILDGLSSAENELVFGANAARFYGLTPRA